MSCNRRGVTVNKWWKKEGDMVQDDCCGRYGCVCMVLHKYGPMNQAHKTTKSRGFSKTEITLI